MESSAVLAGRLENDRAAIATLNAAGRRVTSALTWAEVARAVVRARCARRLDAQAEAVAIRDIGRLALTCEQVDVSDEILLRAGRPFPVEPVRTLDAIHLATLDMLGEAPERVLVVTRDARVRANARALGYAVA